jgi:hypothetical protein
MLFISFVSLVTSGSTSGSVWVSEFVRCRLWGGEDEGDTFKETGGDNKEEITEEYDEVGSKPKDEDVEELRGTSRVGSSSESDTFMTSQL